MSILDEEARRQLEVLRTWTPRLLILMAIAWLASGTLTDAGVLPPGSARARLSIESVCGIGIVSLFAPIPGEPMLGAARPFFSMLSLDALSREFLLGILKHALGGHRYLGNSYRALGPHPVPDDFAGICVAAGADPASDDYLLGELRALGIQRVRLDFTYGSDDEPTGRLLTRLLDEHFDVLLHLVQPFDEASRMHEEAVQQRWRGFVQASVERYGAHIALVEVGSTINRKRWAGYTLNGWLTAWRIAQEEIRATELTLLGPNVTDFEPIYNEALLGMLQRRNLLPDIHSNNIFAERAIEPEAWDHKVLGDFAKRMLKVNLVGKARILQQLGARYGVAHTISTNAFWTLPRIQRILPDGEAKQADYIARYMILTAVSGALGRAYWGPMISQREGVIDDGTRHNPDLDPVTFYGQSFGDWHHYRRRPAFDALAQFQQMLPGSDYLGPSATTAGLELHRFRGAEGETHVAWTTNGRCAVLESLYERRQLEQAEIRHRDGGEVNQIPALVTESPLYLHWRDRHPVQVRAEAGVLPEVAIHTHRRDGEHFYFRDQGWHGMIVAADADEADRLLQALHPARIGGPQKEQSLRWSRNAIWRIADPRTRGHWLVAKQPARMRWHKRILDRRHPSKAKRSWNGACELLRRGIATPAPVAWFERENETDLMRNWYICALADNVASVREPFKAFSREESSYQGITEEDFYRRLSNFLLDMHKRGVFFRDLSAGNILVHIDGQAGLWFSLIDTGRARFNNTGTPLLQRLSDLRRTCHKLYWPGRMRFMEIYLGSLGKSFTRLYRLYFYLYDLKADWKRALQKK